MTIFLLYPHPHEHTFIRTGTRSVSTGILCNVEMNGQNISFAEKISGRVSDQVFPRIDGITDYQLAV